MELKLTYRQRQFLQQFIDYYFKVGHDVHYVTFAEDLGLGNSSVYEMLRALEFKGLVSSDYRFYSDSHQRGPGRPCVVFNPTPLASQILCPKIPVQSLESRAWRNLKENVFMGLRELKKTGYEACLTSLVNRITKRRSPLLFAAEMITMLLVMIVSYSDAKIIRPFLNSLSNLTNIGDLNYSYLKHQFVTFSNLSSVNESFFNTLSTQSQKVEHAISDLRFEHRIMLTEFVRDAARILSKI
ncbi:MAG TPA: hypothetical protein VN226_03845 [Anaerolineales bacterium]|nr:hypothetical protein [Anaerolineales bacterium]